MLALRKRGTHFFTDLTYGGVRASGSLGTKNCQMAKLLVRLLEIAVAEGADSIVWAKLNDCLPHSTFVRFSRITRSPRGQLKLSA